MRATRAHLSLTIGTGQSRDTVTDLQRREANISIAIAGGAPSSATEASAPAVRSQTVMNSVALRRQRHGCGGATLILGLADATADEDPMCLRHPERLHSTTEQADASPPTGRLGGHSIFSAWAGGTRRVRGLSPAR